MGKGARTRIANAEEVKAKREAKIKAEQKKKRNKLTARVIALVLAAGLAVGVCVNQFYFKNGAYLRGKTAATTANATIDAAMMTYLFENTYNNYTTYAKNAYGDYYSYFFNIDEAKSLKNQMYSEGENQSWFDELLGYTKDTTDELLALYEAGKTAGFTLTEEQESLVDRMMSDVDLADYSSQVSEKDVRKVLEIKNYAGWYKQSLETSEAYTLTDAAAEENFEENYTDYTKVSYLSYAVPYEIPEDEVVVSEEDADESADDEEIIELGEGEELVAEADEAEESSEEANEDAEEEVEEDAEGGIVVAEEEADETEEAVEPETVVLSREEALELVDTLMAAETEEAFKAAAEAADKKLNPEITDEDLARSMDEMISKEVSYNADSEASVWAFDKERAVGEKYTEDSNADNTSVSGTYTVYYLTKTAEKDESKTVNARHILIRTDNYKNAKEANDKANEILAEFNAGDKSEESFASLAIKYNSDSGSYYSAGLYENIYESQMVAAFNDWIFDAARQVGDADVVTTDYGFHVVYFAGEGDARWEADVKSNYKDTKYDEDLETFKESYPVSYNDDVLAKIPA